MFPFGHGLLLALALVSVACSPNNHEYSDVGATCDAGAPDDPADAGTEPDAALTEDGLPRVNSSPGTLAVDVLRGVGNRYYLVVSEQQLERMNERYGGGGFRGPLLGDIYTPGGGAGGDATGGETGDASFVDRLLVSTPGASPNTADFGKVQVKLVGESTGRPWTSTTLPNFKIDADEFTPGNRIGGVKHLRLNNAVLGNIFREKLALDLYETLGYPAPRATYAWVQSSVWGPEVDVPYVVVESYKPAFCKQRAAALNGGCLNMWEFPGDFGMGRIDYGESCQFSECDSTRALEFEAAVVAAPQGPGFKAALAEWLDWDAFHRFQCLSWILATGDDMLHNSNNFVLMERADGKFQHLPYSVDISLGHERYPNVSLAGSSLVARGCQGDPQCWDDTVATCEVLLDAFTAANPIAMLDANYATLAQQGMLRGGDEERHASLSRYLACRIEELPVELEEYREGPPTAFCDFPLALCGDVCLLPDECPVCEPEPEPLAADAGVDVETSGAAADSAMAIPAEPAVDPGEPQQGLPFVRFYDPARSR